MKHTFVLKVFFLIYFLMVASLKNNFPTKVVFFHDLPGDILLDSCCHLSFLGGTSRRPFPTTSRKWDDHYYILRVVFGRVSFFPGALGLWASEEGAWRGWSGTPGMKTEFIITLFFYSIAVHVTQNIIQKDFLRNSNQRLDSSLFSTVNTVNLKDLNEKPSMKIPSTYKENKGNSFVEERKTYDELRNPLFALTPSELFLHKKAVSLNIDSSKLSMNPRIHQIVTSTPSHVLHRRNTFPNAENTKTDSSNLIQNKNVVSSDKLIISNEKISSLDLSKQTRLDLQQPVNDEEQASKEEVTNKNTDNMKKADNPAVTISDSPTNRITVTEKYFDGDEIHQKNEINQPSLGNSLKNNKESQHMEDSEDLTNNINEAEKSSNSEEKQTMQVDNVNDKTNKLNKEIVKDLNDVNEELPEVIKQNLVMDTKPNSNLSSESEDSFFDTKIEDATAYKNFFKNLDAELKKEESSSNGVEKEMTEIIDDKIDKQKAVMDSRPMEKMNQDTNKITKFQPSIIKKNFLATLSLDSDTDTDVAAEAKVNSSDEFSFYS